MAKPSKQDGKIIRFYANIQPREIMNMLSIEDLKANGFVNLRYKGLNNPATGVFQILEDSKMIVHQSVPIANSKASTEGEEYSHPIIRFELNYGWEAKLGAQRFPLRGEVELWRFMKLFNYPLPIDSK